MLLALEEWGCKIMHRFRRRQVHRAGQWKDKQNPALVEYTPQSILSITLYSIIHSFRHLKSSIYSKRNHRFTLHKMAVKNWNDWKECIHTRRKMEHDGRSLATYLYVLHFILNLAIRKLLNGYIINRIINRIVLILKYSLEWVVIRLKNSFFELVFQPDNNPFSWDIFNIKTMRLIILYLSHDVAYIRVSITSSYFLIRNTLGTILRWRHRLCRLTPLADCC